MSESRHRREVKVVIRRVGRVVGVADVVEARVVQTVLFGHGLLRRGRRHEEVRRFGLAVLAFEFLFVVGHFSAPIKASSPGLGRPKVSGAQGSALRLELLVFHVRATQRANNADLGLAPRLDF